MKSHGRVVAFCWQRVPSCIKPLRTWVVVEGLVDANEPPMPPKVTAEQTAKFLESIARGTSDASGILKTVLKNKVRELV